MRDSILEVPEGSDPSVRIVIKDPENSNAPFPLTGFTTLEFYVKESPSAPDGLPLYTTANGSIVIDVPDTLGTARMQMNAADLVANRRWFRLDGIKSGRRVTLGYGLLKIKDV